VTEAQKYCPGALEGDVVEVEMKAKQFGRIAAQTAKGVIIQGIREAEREVVFGKFNSKSHEMLTGSVLRIDPTTGDMTVRIGTGTDKTDALLGSGEQVKGESYTEGDTIRVYVVDVRKSNRGPQVIVSRTHPGLVKRLFELEVPEIADGTVEIKSVAREAGSRTKLAVWANDPDVDPVGTCVGPRGGRVGAVVDELGGEKMDIIKYSEDPAAFVAAALSPADVTPAPRTAVWWCLTISSLWPLARRARMPVWQHGSPVIKLISSPRLLLRSWRLRRLWKQSWRPRRLRQRMRHC
jgi:N utilization substance protein A